MIQQLSSDSTIETFDNSILPRRVKSSSLGEYTESPQEGTKALGENRIIIHDEIFWKDFHKTESISDLLLNPGEVPLAHQAEGT